MWCSCGFFLLEPDLGAFYSEPHDVEFDGGATFLCALSADVDGEFKSELQGAGERGHFSLLRRKMSCMGTVDEVGEKSRLLCAPHRLLGVALLRVLDALWVLLRRGQAVILLSFVAYDSSFSVRVESPVSSALMLLCMVLTLHATHRIHTVCTMLVLS